MKRVLEKVAIGFGIFKHDFREIGTGNVYSQKSSFYQCKKCDAIMYVPLGMQEMLIMRGCKK